MLQAWAPLLFADEQLPELRKLRDPILPASISPTAQNKRATHQTKDGFPVHSFSSLMDDLATRVRVTYLWAQSRHFQPDLQASP
jgi:hypothetical protein